MSARLRRILAGLFILITGAFIVWFNASKTKLLIVQSYDESYSWTRDVSVGLRRTLGDDAQITERWYYMDTKRHPSKTFKQNAGLSAQRVIDTWHPNLVIAVDDDAQEYALKHYVNDPHLAIVFAGVNGGVKQYGYEGASNVTGIYERKQLQGVKEVIGIIGHELGHAPRVMHLGDTSGSVRKDEKFMLEFDWTPLDFKESRLVKTFVDWQQAVLEAPKQVDFIITSNYRALARSATDARLVPPREVVSWTEANSKVPVIGTNGFYVEDGGMLAIGTSPYEQGDVAARMALEILRKGRKPSSIPYEQSRQFVVFMRKSRLAAHGIKLPRIYEAFARATNNYYE